MKTHLYVHLWLLLVCIGAATHTASAQRTLVQFSGLVMSSDSLMALPYVSVYVKATSLGTITNTKGFFTLVAHPGDTVVFSSIGYQTVSYVVPASLIEPRYSVIQLMTRDTINLAETVVYPWPSKEQFREAFLSLQIPDDDLDRARKNLEREALKEMGESLPQDSDEVLDYYAQSQADKLYYYGQTPPMNIFSPLAWAQFIKAWRNGDFKKK
jgi:signal peptidase I